RVPLPRPRARVLERACPREQPGLVDAREQHVRACAKYLAPAGAAVDAPGGVAGGPHAAESDRRSPPQEIAGHGARAPGSVQRSPIGGLAHERIGIDRSAARSAQVSDRPYVARGVHELELGLLGRRGLAARPTEPVALGERVLERDQALWGIRMRGGVDTRVVLQAGRVTVVEPVAHWTFRHSWFTA